MPRMCAAPKAHKIKSVLFVWAPVVLRFFAAYCKESYFKFLLLHLLFLEILPKAASEFPFRLTKFLSWHNPFKRLFVQTLSIFYFCQVQPLQLATMQSGVRRSPCSQVVFAYFQNLLYSSLQDLDYISIFTSLTLYL